MIRQDTLQLSEAAFLFCITDLVVTLSSRSQMFATFRLTEVFLAAFLKGGSYSRTYLPTI